MIPNLFKRTRTTVNAIYRPSLVCCISHITHHMALKILTQSTECPNRFKEHQDGILCTHYLIFRNFLALRRAPSLIIT